jgi:hypothetical protein
VSTRSRGLIGASRQNVAHSRATIDESRNKRQAVTLKRALLGRKRATTMGR